MIPRTLIQTWRTTDLPAPAQRLAEGWRARNPEFDYRLFDDAACDRLVAETVPQHLDAYRAFPYPVMRADFFRYAAVHRLGGLYADIDMECLMGVGSLLGLGRAVFSVEAQLTGTRQTELGYSRPFQVANCIFAAEPGHPFLMEAMDRAALLFRDARSVSRETVEDLTGPRMLTRLYLERERDDIALLAQIHLMAPMHYPAVWPLSRNMHARHHAFGSWKAKMSRPLRRIWIERDRWPNPFPASRLVGGGIAS